MTGSGGLLGGTAPAAGRGPTGGVGMTTGNQ